MNVNPIEDILGHPLQYESHGRNYSYFDKYDNITLMELYLNKVIKDGGIVDLSQPVDYSSGDSSESTGESAAEDSHSSGHRRRRALAGGGGGSDTVESSEEVEVEIPPGEILTQFTV